MIASALLLTLIPAVPAQSPAPEGQQAASTLHWGDFDGDGLLDVLRTYPRGPDRLLRNSGDGSFQDVTERVGLARGVASRVVRWMDHDQDGDVDLLRVAREGTVTLFTNEAGRFTRTPNASELATITDALGGEWLDYDGDGLPDLQLTCASGDRLFHNEGQGFLVPVDLGPLGFVGSPVSPALAPMAPAPAIGVGGSVGTGTRNPPTAPAGSFVATSMPPPTAAPGSGFCADALVDQASPGGACIQASTLATVGMLYPLGDHLRIDEAGGFVNIGTPALTVDLYVHGMVGAGSVGYQFPDGSIQTTACDCEAIWAAIGQLQDDLLATNHTLASHGNRLDTAESDISNLNSATSQNASDIDDVAQRVGDTEDAVGGLTDSVGLMQGQISFLDSRTSNLEQRTSPLDYDGTTLFVHGANLQITDGDPSATAPNGLGNLFIGHNKDIGGDFQTGSHNFVLGDGHSFNGFTGLIVGEDNTLRGNYAVVLGGINNEASNYWATTLGGFNNSATGFGATTVGGDSNHANGSRTLIAGGGDNVINSQNVSYASIFGGTSGLIDSGSDASTILGGTAALISSSQSAVALGGVQERVIGYSPNYSKPTLNFDEIFRTVDGILARLDNLEGP